MIADGGWGASISGGSQPSGQPDNQVWGYVEFGGYAVYYAGILYPGALSIPGAAGLGVDAFADWAEGSPIGDEGKFGHVLPGGRGPVIYLPGIHPNGCIDWPLVWC